MLYLKFSANLQKLADTLIEELESEWKDPLESPMVIFADKKMEQWFRLQWVKKRGILANLKAMRLESFLWEALQPEPDTHPLNGDILHPIIQAALVSKNPVNDKECWQNWNDLQLFLAKEGNPLVIDPVKLTELSAELARLFLEYEYSRPQHFYEDKKGILDCWKQGHSVQFFSTSKEDPIETWQRELYGKLFHDEPDAPSFITQAQASNYLTLTYLFNTHKEKLKALSNQSIFIFGLSGVGQFHRVILQEIAQTASVHAYIQNPCAEFWEDVNTTRKSREFTQKNAPTKLKWTEDLATGEEPDVSEDENQLLQLWGQTGRENIKLWSQATDYNFNALEDSEPAPSLLGSIQSMILHRSNTLNIPVQNDDSLTLAKARSKRREVEQLREQVWKDLQKNRELRLDEMIVLVPDLESYRVVINQVFSDTEPNGYEYLPYTITDAEEKASYVVNAVQTFLNIVQSKEINRPQFFDLIRNPIVQKARGLTEAMVTPWEDWVLGMNVYRSKNDKDFENPHSWAHGVQRLLLYRLMRTPYAFGETAFHPFGTFDSSDDNSLSAFCDALKSLESFIDKFHKKNSPSRQRELFFAFCREWINVEDLNTERPVQKNLFNTLFAIDWQERVGRNTLPFDEFKILVQRALKGARPGSSDFLMSGLSFAKFQPDRALPMKVIYMLGMNEEDFPGHHNPSTLDLRTPTELRQKRWPGDSNPIAKNRYAFLCELMSATQKLRISYLGYNAKKDKRLAPSSVIEELRSFIENHVLRNEKEKGIWKLNEGTFDERRPINEIYSTHGLYQKYLALENNEPKKVAELAQRIPGTLPMELQAKQLQRFLKNPFEFQIEAALHLSEDDVDKTRIPLEPIEVDNLYKAILGKKLLHDTITTGEFHASEIKLYEEQGFLPEGLFGEKTKRDLQALIETQIQDEAAPKNYLEGELLEWDFLQEAILVTRFTGTPEWICKTGENTTALLTTCNGDAHLSHFLHSLVCAMIIAANAKEEQHFTLSVVSGKDKKSTDIRKFTLLPEEASDWLIAVGKKAFQEKFRVNLPILFLEDYFDRKVNHKEALSKEDFLEDLNKDSFGKYWAYRNKEASLFVESDWSIPETEKAFTELVDQYAEFFKKLYEASL